MTSRSLIAHDRVAHPANGPSLPTVSAVIATYNRRHQLEETITAVGADPAVREIVVVVDGCNDGSLELANELATVDHRIRVVWQANGGDAAARQAGIQHATCDVVLLLDDDVVAGPGLATGHARWHAKISNAVILGYMPVDLPIQRRPGAFATYLYASEYECQCAKYESDPSRILNTLWTGNLSLRRDDAMRIGFQSDGERLAYHSDQAFGLRCQRQQMVGVFDRQLVAIHRHDRDMDSFIRQSRMRGSDRRILERQYPDLPQSAICTRPAAAGTRCRRRRRGTVAAPARHRNDAMAHRPRRAGALVAVETALARCMRQVELRRGYRERSAR